MRPRRLEIEGFTSFRERTVVDFDGVDLFALSGPTGAGKSSIIDAIVFVLYGAVPRYDDQRAVAPVITQGKNEARLDLTFSVGKVDYRATRVVSRTKGKGATTKNARLERIRPGGDPEDIAATADEVTAAVEDLLGLGFEHFTRCVVLPQGEFARFLLDKPKDRQALLVRLLDLGKYEEMGQRARARGGSLGTKAEVLGGKLEQIGEASPELVTAADHRRQDAEGLEARFAAAAPKLAGLQDALRQARDVAGAAQGAIDALGAIAVPEDAGDLSAATTAARGRTAECEAAESEAEDALAVANAELGALADPGVLARLIAGHQRRDKLVAEIHEAEAGLAPLARADADAAAAAAGAAEQVEAAQLHLRAVEDTHRAHTLAGTLTTGGPCPVCLQTVTTLPVLETPEAVPAAEAAVAAAEKERKSTDTQASSAARAHRDVENAITGLRKQVTELAAELAEAPTADECARRQQQRADVEAAVGAATSAFESARKHHATARQDLERAERAEKSARADFLSTRDRVAAWSPPEAGNDDLSADWAALVAWADARVPTYRDDLAKGEAAAAAVEQEATAIVADLSAAAAELGIEAIDHAGLGTAVSRVAEQARIAHKTAVSNLEQAEELRAAKAALEAAKGVADSLGRHLSKGGTGFQTWLQQEAQEQLVVRATEILMDLSDGAYSLTLDDKGGFDVVDHRNADQPRSARTLSGGETFLASLALALALGDHIGSMAARGTARLESLFLDEGFGTLDPDTLSTVADAIAELSSKGRMVGIVTHVRELAEQGVPVRFEVTKGPGGSSVARVDT